ncbi:MAG: serine hydrolase domain-containing protein [Brevundimonas sp.]
MKILHLWPRRWRSGGRGISRFAAGLCLFLAACTGSAAPNLGAQIDAQLEANASLHGIPAQSVLVIRNGEVIYRNQIGLADIETQRAVRPDDVYAVYSVSKLFVSTLILELVDQGRVDLEAPASRYVADLPPAWRDVRIDQLLNHASGLPEYFEGGDGSGLPATRTDLFRILGAKPLDFPPGTQSRYNQTNYLVLQAVLEQLHGMPYRRIVQTRIIEPLGLREVYLGSAPAPAARRVSAYRGEDGVLVAESVVAWPDYSIAHADLFTTADDLGAFLTAVAQGRFARPQTLARLWRPYRLPNGGVTDFASGWDYGESGGYREVGHDGGVKVRVRLLFRDDLSDHYVIVYLTNGTRDNVWTRRLIDSVQPLVLQRD